MVELGAFVLRRRRPDFVFRDHQLAGATGGDRRNARRVMSVYNVAFRGGIQMGSFLTGGFVDRLGVQVVVAGMGGMPAAVGSYLFFIHRKVARL
jgi:predicted MFS family arabinose efflux permease